MTREADGVRVKPTRVGRFLQVHIEGGVMKITAVKPIPITADRPYLFVKVETDEGIYGIGT